MWLLWKPGGMGAIARRRRDADRDVGGEEGVVIAVLAAVQDQALGGRRILRLEPSVQRAIRLSVGLSQKELEALLGYRQGAVNAFETGKRQPPIDLHYQVLARIRACSERLDTNKARREFAAKLAAMAAELGPGPALVALFGGTR